MRSGDCGYSLQSKGNFLYSAATANSTMDFSTTAVEEGVVDSPPAHIPLENGVCSPSPLRSTRVMASPVDEYGRLHAVQRNLYSSMPASLPFMPCMV
jgi:hypothetical protein